MFSFRHTPYLWIPWSTSSWSEVKVSHSCATLCDPMDWTVHGILQARILEWVACPFSRGASQHRDRSNPGFLHCRQILYQLSHKGSPRIQEWVAYPFSRGSSLPRNWTGVSCIAGGFFLSTELSGNPSKGVSSFSRPEYWNSFFRLSVKSDKVLGFSQRLH